ncbi:MAG: extracellular solute-binding protein [Chloroflexota bacterium]
MKGNKFVSMVVVLSMLALVLTSCAPKVVKETVVVEKAVKETVVVEVTPVPAAPVTITVWFTPRGTVQEYTLTMIKLFEARNPGITVAYEPMPDIMQKLRTGVAAGELPDFVYVDENVALEFLDILKPIPDWVMTGDKIRTRFGDFVADFYNWDGKYYILPYGVMTGGALFYNKEILEQYGYTPEDIPKTWDEFIEMAKEMTIWEGDELKQAGFAIRGQEQFIWDSVLFQEHGYRFLNCKTCSVDSSEAKEAAKFMMDIYNVHKLDSLTGLPAMEAFGTGKAPFGYFWSWYIGFMARTYPQIKYGTTTLPTFTGEPPYGRISYNLGFAITATDPAREEAAWKFYDFLMSNEFIDGWSPLRGSAPVSAEVHKGARYQTAPWAGVIKVLEPGNGRTEGPWPEETADMLNEMLASILAGEDIDTTMDDTARRATAILQAGDYCRLLIGKEGFEKIFGQPW